MASSQYQPSDSGSAAVPSKKGKRKAQGDEKEDTSEAAVAKRNRVHYSCVECNRRKQKCDRKDPCAHCIARKVPHLCRPFINGTEDPNQYDADVRSRLDRIEDLLTNLVENPSGSSSSKLASSSNTSRPALTVSTSPGALVIPRPGTANRDSHTDGSEDGGRSMLGDEEGGDEHDGTMRNGRFYGPSASSAMSSGARMSRLLQNFPVTAIGASAAALPEHHPPSPLSQHLPHILPRTHSNTALYAQTQPLPPALQSALDTLDESGIGLDNVLSLLEKLPTRDMRNSLVELYWKEIDWTRFHIYQPDFQARYISFFSHESSSSRNHSEAPYPFRNLDAAGLKWLPLLFIMMAIATLTAPLSLFGDEGTRRVWSRSLYGSARKAINLAQALQRDTLDVLAARLLIGRYLLLVRRAAEGFTPLTTALQLGLYRDGTNLGLTNPREIELRRRFWSYTLYADRSASLLVGRPTLVSPSSYDTKPPANLDDVDLMGDFDPEGRPMSQPTVMTHVILRHGLAEIMGRISEKIFSLKSPQYSTVVEIDQELIEWKHTLPSYFKLENPDKSFDAKYHYLAFHRSMLASEFYYTRITLHRPYMLKKRDSQIYAYSRKAAVEAARADLIGRRDFLLNRPKGLGLLSTGSYWVLNSFIIVGLSILLEPTSAQSDELRSLLNVVTGRAPDQEGRVSEATVRELAIVELFTQKDQIALDSAPTSPSFSRANLPPSDLNPYGQQNSHGFAGAGKRSIMAQDFLAPPASTFASSAVASAEPGQSFWGEKDPVDQLLIQYHRSRGEVMANNAYASGSRQQQQQQQAEGGNDAWSEVPRGLAEHSVQGPAFAPHHNQPHLHPLQQQHSGQQSPSSALLLHTPFSQQRSSLSLSPNTANANASGSVGGGPQAQYPFSAPVTTSMGGSQHPQASFGPFGSFGIGGMATPAGGLVATGDGGEFLSPWSHHAGGLGVGAGAGEEVDLLGDAKELAFLNQLISAISSGDGPSQ
ncbi:hypothetical protein BDY24DRAFT_380316 [Mrakia frigida]|uniref:uncharacterized protein n=1 Tax=Mrakia frigida TaxID=29902 RepID=UPI003FCC0B43